MNLMASSPKFPTYNMPVKHSPRPSDASSPSSILNELSVLRQVNGVAVFGLDGLSEEYFSTDENSDTGWIQIISHTLGMQSLLSSALQVDGFRHAIIHGSSDSAIVIKQFSRYLAFFVSGETLDDLADKIVSGMRNFDPGMLYADPRFSVVLRF